MVLNITVSGGVSPYSYNWGGGVTIEDRTNLSAGTYNVTSTDTKGCSISSSISITQPAALSFSNDYAKEGVANAPNYVGSAQMMYQNASEQAAAKAKAKSGGMLGGMGGTIGSGIGMAFGGPMGAALGGAIGGGLDGGDMQGAVSGGLGGAMQGYGGNLGWAQGMGNSVRGMFAPGYKDTAGLAAGVPQF